MSYRIEKDVMVPMRDGQTLATDVWVPDGGPAPTLLVRTPYGKDVPNLFANALNPQALLEAGYAVVFQDCRGTYRSDGAFTPMLDEPHDGADTVAWLSEQTWCDGNVGMFSASYLGFTQWATAGPAPDGLKPFAPTVTTTDFYSAPWYSDGGALSLHMSLWWSTRRRPLLHHTRARGAGRGHRAHLPRAVREFLGDRHRLHREARRCLPRRTSDLPHRRHPADPIPELADPARDAGPEQVYGITLALWVTSNVFLPGHRFRLEVSSRNFPRYDRNTNTGGVIAGDTSDQAIVATNRMLHGCADPGRLVLPIVVR